MVPVRLRGAGPVTREGRHGLAAVYELENVVGTLTVDLEHETARQGVHHRDAHPVETTRHLVTVPAELPTCVKRGEHQLGGRAVRVLLVRADRDPATVVRDAASAVGQQRHVDSSGAALHRLVDRVVDDLPDEVVKPARSGGTDVHPGPLLDRLEACQDSDVARVVRRHRRPISRIRPCWCFQLSAPRARPFDCRSHGTSSFCDQGFGRPMSPGADDYKCTSEGVALGRFLGTLGTLRSWSERYLTARCQTLDRPISLV